MFKAIKKEVWSISLVPQVKAEKAVKWKEM